MKTKDELPACPVATAVSLIGGKWKLLILRNLKSRPWRFNELQRDLDGISQKVLTDSLRQMMDDGLAYRRDYHEMPPRVEYGLTELGKEMLPIIDALADFGNYYKSVVGYVFEVAEANCSLFFVEIPEVDLVSFERGFRPGIPQTEMMVMVGGRTIGHHFASQCLQRMDETAAFIDRVNARGWVNRGIVVREQQFISYLIV